MELIITKEFLDMFFVCQEEDNIIHADFNKFLTKQVRNINLITNFSDINELQNLANENPIWELLLDRGIINIDYNPNLKVDISNLNFYQSGSAFKLFCVDFEKDVCADLSNRFGYEYLTLENLTDRWKIYFSEREDYHLPVDTLSNPCFDTWQKLRDFSHPINSIIIFDKYLFNEIQMQKGCSTKQWDISDNLYEVFKNLIKDVDNELELSITIILSIDYISFDDITMPTNKVARLNFAQSKIIDFFNTNYIKLKFNISIIHYKRSIHSTSKEHGRGIYTNYFYIFIEQGLNIFNCSGNIINNTHISYFFPFRNTDKSLVMSKLCNFKTYINDLDNYLVLHPTVNRSGYYSGSINNRLIENI